MKAEETRTAPAQTAQSRTEAARTALTVGWGPIGLSFARRCADAGWRVHICDVNPDCAARGEAEFGQDAAFFTELAGTWAETLPSCEPDPDRLQDVCRQVNEAYGTDEASFAEQTARRNG